MNAAAMGVESSVRKKSSRWGPSSIIDDEEIRNAMEVEIRRLTEEEEFEKNITNTMREEQVLKKTRNAMRVEKVLRKKSSRWGGSSSSMEGVMDEDIRNAMEVEIRRLTEEEEFEKNTINAMREEEELVRNKIWNLMWVERVSLSESMMGVTDEEFRKEGEKIQKKIRNAIQQERDRLISMRLRVKRPFVSMYEDIRNAMEEEITRREVQTDNYLMEMDPAAQIRDARFNFVLHISPLEIIDNPGDQDFINGAADNINQIELVIIVINHQSIHQYWAPRSTTSSYVCQHHDDYLHPRDDDDKEMILATCRPLLDSPQRIKIVLDGGVFAAVSDDDEHIMSSTTLLRSVDVLFEYNILPTHKHLEDLKRSITLSISEAKPHVLSVKPGTYLCPSKSCPKAILWVWGRRHLCCFPRRCSGLLGLSIAPQLQQQYREEVTSL